ncbi:MAG: penicillin acylase family protein, partial [Pseudomonadota bacterium]|nr:penicillin acylase family protein [Pseudomonadota bacterium]
GWLPEGKASWQAVQLAAIDEAISEATRGGGTLADATWGRRNTSHIAHPFAATLPWGARWLMAPAEALPGDIHMPRVAGPEFGQSERLVVSPGHESEAIFNMPGGASGHPLSPYFLAGHADWVNARPSSFVPAAQVHLLTLEPLRRP